MNQQTGALNVQVRFVDSEEKDLVSPCLIHLSNSESITIKDFIDRCLRSTLFDKILQWKVIRIAHSITGPFESIIREEITPKTEYLQLPTNVTTIYAIIIIAEHEVYFVSKNPYIYDEELQEQVKQGNYERVQVKFTGKASVSALRATRKQLCHFYNFEKMERRVMNLEEKVANLEEDNKSSKLRADLLLEVYDKLSLHPKLKKLEGLCAACCCNKDLIALPCWTSPIEPLKTEQVTDHALCANCTTQLASAGKLHCLSCLQFVPETHLRTLFPTILQEQIKSLMRNYPKSNNDIVAPTALTSTGSPVD